MNKARLVGMTLFPNVKPELMSEVERFLMLVVASPHPLVPSILVDGVIHRLLDHPNLRRRVERELGGRLVHDPTLTGEAMFRAYRQTIAAYRNAFGNPPTSVWADLDDPPTLQDDAQPAVCGISVAG